ncbi:hypothetical protein [Salsipaludibacter albus]|uniref:hypothetical protein n=1 Tax=Salsipaludibacter albus TaxID=2849650 RepID=UPI001EE4C0DF|nr:hypothetical protein [Salsipaludibacter albus]MBY5160903.1 hypothetical protein [Salsipaludibacter albus]
MHPEHSAMMSRLVMEERHREASAWRLQAMARPATSAAWRARLGDLLVRAGTRLGEHRAIPAARRA